MCVSQRATATEEAHAIGLKLARTAVIRINHCDVGGPHLGLVRGPPPPRRKQNIALLRPFRLDEQFGECRMSGIGFGRSKDQFGIRG